MKKKSALRNIISDQEFWLILVFNVAIVILYLDDRATASSIVFLYYLQSLFIGLQYFVRMLVNGYDGQQVGFGKKYGAAFFFLFHYGFFHVVYFVFLISILVDLPGSVDFQMVRYLFLAILGNTIFSTISDIKRDRSGVRSIGVFFQPYLRIVPMHIFIILGFNLEGNQWDNVFILFIGLKLIADLVAHIIINQTYKEKRPNVTEGWI